jgi:hypothetical protein
MRTENLAVIIDSRMGSTICRRYTRSIHQFHRIHVFDSANYLLPTWQRTMLNHKSFLSKPVYIFILTIVDNSRVDIVQLLPQLGPSLSSLPLLSDNKFIIVG